MCECMCVHISTGKVTNVRGGSYEMHKHDLTSACGFFFFFQFFFLYFSLFFFSFFFIFNFFLFFFYSRRKHTVR